MAKPDEEHNCPDFVAEDPDDFLSFICVCGHVEEEHERGLFRRCKFDTNGDDEEGD